MKSYIPPHAIAFYTAAPKATEKRNYLQEALQIARGNQQAAPINFETAQQYYPQYANLQNQTNAVGMFGTDTGGVHTPGSLEQGAAANTFTRGSDVADVTRLGPSVTAAQLNANPFLAGGLQNLYGRMGDSPILGILNQQAQTQLGQNGALSNEDYRNATQGARRDFADRGMFGGNQSVIADVLSRQGLTDQRRAAAQQFAGQVQGLNNQQNDFVGRGTQIFSTALADPFSVLLGRTGGAYGGGSGGGSNSQIGSAAQLFSPTNAYAGDVFSSNQNAQYANSVNQANATNANIGTWAQIFGRLGSDYLSGGYG